MQSPNFNLLGDCEEGYMGPMCTVCIPGYEKSGPNKCTECPIFSLRVIKLVFFLLVNLSSVFIMIYQNFKQALKDQSEEPN